MINAGSPELWIDEINGWTACGVKACVGCSIKTKFGMKKVCHDGPVFDSETIVDFDPVVEKTETCCGN